MAGATAFYYCGDAFFTNALAAAGAFCSFLAGLAVFAGDFAAGLATGLVAAATDLDKFLGAAVGAGPAFGADFGGEVGFKI